MQKFQTKHRKQNKIIWQKAWDWLKSIFPNSIKCHSKSNLYRYNWRNNSSRLSLVYQIIKFYLLKLIIHNSKWNSLKPDYIFWNWNRLQLSNKARSTASIKRIHRKHKLLQSWYPARKTNPSTIWQQFQNSEQQQSWNSTFI